jgi:hypothetical protein
MNMTQKKEELIAEGRALQQEVKDQRRMLEEAGNAAQAAEERVAEAERALVELRSKDDAAPYRRGCPKDHAMPKTGSLFAVEGFIFCTRGHFRVYGQTVFNRPVEEPAP